jgi:hypothetical protein
MLSADFDSHNVQAKTCGGVNGVSLRKSSSLCSCRLRSTKRQVDERTFHEIKLLDRCFHVVAILSRVVGAFFSFSFLLSQQQRRRWLATIRALNRFLSISFLHKHVLYCACCLSCTSRRDYIPN